MENHILYKSWLFNFINHKYVPQKSYLQASNLIQSSIKNFKKWNMVDWIYCDSIWIANDGWLNRKRKKLKKRKSVKRKKKRMKHKISKNGGWNLILLIFQLKTGNILVIQSSYFRYWTLIHFMFLSWKNTCFDSIYLG